MRLSGVRIGNRDTKSRDMKSRDMKSRDMKSRDTKSRQLSTSSLLTVILQQITSCGLRGISKVIQREAKKALNTSTWNLSAL
jgi:hypothetical protein